MRSSLCNLFMKKLRGSTPLPFPWKAIWRTKAPRRVSFFAWTATGEKFSLVRISLRNAFQWRVGVVCAIVAGRLWITSWFTVAWLLSYGILSLGCLGFSGFYRRSSLIYYLSGDVMDQIRISRILSLYVCCGLYGGNIIGVFLKMWSACLLKYKQPSSVLFTSGLLY